MGQETLRNGGAEWRRDRTRGRGQGLTRSDLIDRAHEADTALSLKLKV